jgi:hypothetical protein
MTSETPPDEYTHDTPAVDPVKSTRFGVVALVLGGFGGVVPFLPADLGDARAWLPLPFVLPGLVIGLIGCTETRRGNAWAIVGSIVCTIAVGLSTVMLIAAPGDGKDTAGPGHTEEILRDELDVRLGERRIDPETGLLYVTVTLYNKGPYTASYGVTLEVDAGGTCEDGVSARLAPGASYQAEIDSCSSKMNRGEDMNVLVTKASKDSYS